MSYASWDEEMDCENEDSWPHLDLLEFIRLAILAMLFFMSLANGFRQPGLIIHVLNGQARFMVSACLLSFSSFCTHLLISLFRNGSTTSLCTRRRFTTFRAGSTNSDSGTWTCSLSLPNLNRRASTWVAIGSYSHMRGLYPPPPVPTDSYGTFFGTGLSKNSSPIGLFLTVFVQITSDSDVGLIGLRC